MSTHKSRPAREGERPETTYRIHPGVGIARAGDSEEDFFVGPEAPGWRPAPDGGYKDAAGRVKRQAARFRIFEYGADGRAIREVTAFDARIEWTVHLANKKAAWFDFVGRYKWEDPAKRALRNPAIQGGPEYLADPDLRTELIVDPGERSLGGAHRGPVAFDTGAFQGRPVHLGELRTDSRGALLVLGGHGKSESVTAENPIKHYANNDNWHDDLADGPVTATVTLPDGTSFAADPAWVIVAPPKFAPNLDDVVTLDELVRDVYIEQKWLPEEEGVEFDRDILPLSEEAFPVSWWFEQPTRDFLEALAWPENGWVTPGEPDASPFVTERLVTSQPMGKAFGDPVPHLGGRTGKEVAIAWIEAGCPVPPPTRSRENLWLTTSQSAWEAHPTHQLLGMAAVH
jgi:hypothetical protein